jgi:membrane protein implicated in regulation of membrane protease activity
MMPFRQDLWNLPQWMYPVHWALVILCGALLVYGLWRRVRLWRMGQPTVRSDQIGKRIKGLLLYGLGQRRILSEAYPGLMHGLIFYSFVAFFIATSLVGIQMDAGLPVLKGSFYLVFELTVNAFTLLFLAGLGLAAFRRYVQRPKRLNIRRDDALILGVLAFCRPHRAFPGGDALARAAAGMGAMVVAGQRRRRAFWITPQYAAGHLPLRSTMPPGGCSSRFQVSRSVR